MTPLLHEKIIVMTGATSGLGKAACLSFANKGAKVIILVRSKSKGEHLIQELKDYAMPKKGTIEVIKCDLSDLEQVNSACEVVLAKYSHIDYLINNAGVWNFSEIKSKNGIELTFQVNVLVPYLLIKKLTPLLIKSKFPKVITTASALHQGDINYEDVEFNRNYSSFKAYRQSKLMVILLTRLFATKEDVKKVQFVTQHPGLVDTGLSRGGGWFARLFFSWFGKSPIKGAQTLIHLVETDQDKLINGAYYASSHEKKTSTALSRNLEHAEKVEVVVMKYLSDYLKA